MKIIFSRKGFDSGYGGVPSPILENDKMLSFPIPGVSDVRYGDLEIGEFKEYLQDLSKDPYIVSKMVHMDPDLSYGMLPRKEGWVGSLGQTGAAAGHLAGQGVGVGDLFLFFGWFRRVKEEGNKRFYDPDFKDQHVLFGYMQIGEVLNLGSNQNLEKVLKEKPWLDGHPHLDGRADKNNTIYVASKNLVLNGETLDLPGFSSFEYFSEKLVLSYGNGLSKSVWKMPEWVEAPNDGGDLTYHKDPGRWSKREDGLLLKSVAKGQEFVMNLKEWKKDFFKDWFLSLPHYDKNNNFAKEKKSKINFKF
jgi:hypothetical protein